MLVRSPPPCGPVVSEGVTFIKITGSSEGKNNNSTNHLYPNRTKK